MREDMPEREAKLSFATGREIHARLARSGPPQNITSQGLPARHQPRMSIEHALEARPVGTAFDRPDCSN